MRCRSGLLYSNAYAISLGLGLWIAFAAGDGPRAARAEARASFQIGAASADVTPPALGAAPAPPEFAACDARYSGPRRFAFEEPYVDKAGAGHYVPGDDYCDANGNGRYDGMYLGGGSGRNRVPVQVLDAVRAQAVVFGGADGKARVATVVLDSLGLPRPVITAIKQAALAQRKDLGQVLVSSTHSESAPDPIGLWGPDEASSGVNDYYLAYLATQAAAAVVRADDAAEPAHLRFVRARQPDSFQTCWSSYPFVHDPSLMAMQAVSARDPRKVVFTLVNYGIHAEVFGFSSDPMLHDALSADWPGLLRDELEATWGGVGVALAGLIGSVEMPQVYPGGVVSGVPLGGPPLTPGDCGYSVFAPPAGIKPIPAGTLAQAQAISRAVADSVRAAFRSQPGEWSRGAVVRAEVSEFCAPLENQFFLQAAMLGLIKRPLGCGGDPAGTPTAVGVVQIGDAEIAYAPGEIFPFTLQRSFLGPGDMPFADQPMTPWVAAQMSGRYNFMAGLGEDMLGYLMPPADFVGEPGEVTMDPWLTWDKTHKDEHDRLGFDHGDDQESLGPHAGQVVAEQLGRTLRDLDPAGPRDTQVLSGRFLDARGRSARSPFPSASFSGAIGVWVLPAGKTDFHPGAGWFYTLPPYALVGGRLADGFVSGFLDNHGLPEAGGYSVATRGVILSGLFGTRRIFVDVYGGSP